MTPTGFQRLPSRELTPQPYSQATICGTKGVIEVQFPFWCPTKFSVQGMTGLGSQTWTEKKWYEFPLPEITGDYNFVNSEVSRHANVNI